MSDVGDGDLDDYIKLQNKIELEGAHNLGQGAEEMKFEDDSKY
jgi:hypothetical protein